MNLFAIVGIFLGFLVTIFLVMGSRYFVVMIRYTYWMKARYEKFDREDEEYRLREQKKYDALIGYSVADAETTFDLLYGHKKSGRSPFNIDFEEKPGDTETAGSNDMGEKDAGPLSDDEDENVKHLIRGQRVTWAEYDETIDLKKAAEHIREGLGNSGLEDVQIDSMTYWVRAYFLGSLDKVEERNGKTVWPSQSEATEAAIRGAVQAGIHGEVTFKTDYDISDGLDCVLIEWKTT